MTGMGRYALKPGRLPAAVVTSQEMGLDLIGEGKPYPTAEDAGSVRTQLRRLLRSFSQLPDGRYVTWAERVALALIERAAVHAHVQAAELILNNTDGPLEGRLPAAITLQVAYVDQRPAGVSEHSEQVITVTPAALTARAEEAAPAPPYKEGPQPLVPDPPAPPTRKRQTYAEIVQEQDAAEATLEATFTDLHTNPALRDPLT